LASGSIGLTVGNGAGPMLARSSMPGTAEIGQYMATIPQFPDQGCQILGFAAPEALKFTISALSYKDP